MGEYSKSKKDMELKRDYLLTLSSILMMLLVWTLCHCHLKGYVTKLMRFCVTIGTSPVSRLLVTASVRVSCHCAYARVY